jgi:Protein of unknown function (DUF3551)
MLLCRRIHTRKRASDCDLEKAEGRLPRTKTFPSRLPKRRNRFLRQIEYSAIKGESARRHAPSQREDNNMKKLMAAGLALSAVVAASGKANAYLNYPWCIIGDTRGIDCVFVSREQCATDGRNRGFGGQCIRNPFYNPALPSVVPSASPARKPSAVVEGETPVKRVEPGRRKSQR